MKIYVASSWRNQYQPVVVHELREKGHEVYDFRNPEEGDHGFHWSQVSTSYPTIEEQREGPFEMNAQRIRDALSHPIAKDGFEKDAKAMKWAEVCVLVLPSGRSAHLEAGVFVGSGRPLIIYIPHPIEPELMYSMGMICISVDEVIRAVEVLENYQNVEGDIERVQSHSRRNSDGEIRGEHNG